MNLALATGDDDQWMLLERVSDDGFPLVVRSRVNAEIQDFVQANTVTALICDVDPELVRDDGFPLCHQELYELEDGLVAAVAAGAFVYHTASVTGDGRRVIYLAHEQEVLIEDMIASVKGTVASVSVMRDVDLDLYRDFVVPTAFDRKSDGDRQVIANLQKGGDDCSEPRKIDFWVYGAREKLEQSIDDFAEQGFLLDHWIEETGGLVLTRDDAPSNANFREWTPFLIECAERHDIEYDGWETFVVKPQPEVAALPQE